MDMKDIETYFARDLGHLHRQRQRVVRVGEQTVFVHDDLVKKDPRLRQIEPNG